MPSDVDGATPTLTDEELLALLGHDVVTRELAADAAWREWLPQAGNDALARLRKHGDFERFCRAVTRVPRGRTDEAEARRATQLNAAEDLRAPAKTDEDEARRAAQLNAAEDLRAPARTDEAEARRAAQLDAAEDLRAPARVAARSGTEPLAACDGAGIPTARLTGPFDFTEVDAALLDLLPWRKGPFRFLRDAESSQRGADESPRAAPTESSHIASSDNSLTLDTEWRSNLKWRRVLDLAPRFDGARVLDVGSGNGYYLLRLLEAGARLAWGIEPSVLYTSQFLAISRAFAPRGAALLPLPVEELSAARLPAAFDVVLSMGVLYHRRDALAHLRELRDLTRGGGQLILETLVVDGPRGHVFTPPGRYAQMRNVFSLPSVLTLEGWLSELGFVNVRSGPVVPTTVEEQRSTRFMPHPSLDSFLEPNASGSAEGTRSAADFTRESAAGARNRAAGFTRESAAGARSAAGFTRESAAEERSAAGFTRESAAGERDGAPRSAACVDDSFVELEAKRARSARRTIEGHPGPARVVLVADLG